MITISLCMIAKNEEPYLAQCLESVRDLVDEIIIVDTGSTDKTKDLARRFTKHVFDFQWEDDFAAARNASFEKATMDYIFWLDADDILKPEDQEKFRQLKQEADGTTDYYFASYNYAFDEQGRVAQSFWRERLFKRTRGFRWYQPIHEHINVTGTFKYVDFAVSHMRKTIRAPLRNIEIFEKLKKQRALTARELFYYGNELHGQKRYDESAAAYEAFLTNPDTCPSEVLAAYFWLALIYKDKGDLAKAKETAFRCFRDHHPRSDLCCLLADCFFEAKDYQTAAFWYHAAINAACKTEHGYYNADCFQFTPNIQLCVCYDRLGKTELAIHHNEEAAKYKPEHPSVIHNRNYFKNLEEKNNGSN